MSKSFYKEVHCDCQVYYYHSLSGNAYANLTVCHCFQSAQVQIRSRLFLLLSEPPTSDVTLELVQQSEELCKLLETRFVADNKEQTETR